MKKTMHSISAPTPQTNTPVHVDGGVLYLNSNIRLPHELTTKSSVYQSIQGSKVTTFVQQLKHDIKKWMGGRLWQKFS